MNDESHAYIKHAIDSLDRLTLSYRKVIPINCSKIEPKLENINIISLYYSNQLNASPAHHDMMNLMR